MVPLFRLYCKHRILIIFIVTAYIMLRQRFWNITYLEKTNHVRESFRRVLNIDLIKKKHDFEFGHILCADAWVGVTETVLRLWNFPRL